MPHQRHRRASAVAFGLWTDHMLPSRVGLAARGGGSADFGVYLAFLDRLPLIELLLAGGDADFDFDQAVFEVEGQWNKGDALFLGLGGKAFEFAFVGEED